MKTSIPKLGEAFLLEYGGEALENSGFLNHDEQGDETSTWPKVYNYGWDPSGLGCQPCQKKIKVAQIYMKTGYLFHNVYHSKEDVNVKILLSWSFILLYIHSSIQPKNDNSFMKNLLFYTSMVTVTRLYRVSGKIQ